jgi:hypothetical protein
LFPGAKVLAKASACKAAPPAPRLRAVAVSALLALALALSPARAAATDSHDVTLSIANDGDDPIRCLILFAHWVVTEAGTIPPGGALAVAMSRQDGDGALWIARADGRRMMIETVECGADARWAETRGQIPLLPARAGRDAGYRTTCRLGGTVVCADPAPLP